MTDRFVTALQNSVVQTVSSSAAQSVVNGDSFTDSLKNSTKNLLINAVGELGANEIGTSFKAGTISKAQQLVLHAGLGCGMAAAGGNNCAAGAASGVIGEVTAEFLSNNTNLTKPQIIESAKLAGAITSAAVAGPDDGNSVFAGSQIARNAAENNYFTAKIFGKEKEEKLDKLLKDLKGSSLDNIADKYVASNDPTEKAALFAILVTGSISLPSSTTELEMMMLTAGVSKAFAPQIAKGLNKMDDAASSLWSKLTNTESFFEGTAYTNKVIGQMKSEPFHGFPESVAAFEQNGTVSTITGGDGKVRQILRIPGEYGNKTGNFEFIKEADGSINHRLFKPNN